MTSALRGYAEVTGSSPVEALIFFFRLLLSNCLNWKIYCDDHSSLSKKLSLPAGSNAEVVANNIGRFFIYKVTSIHSKLGNAVNSNVPTQDMENNLA